MRKKTNLPSSNNGEELVKDDPQFLSRQYQLRNRIRFNKDMIEQLKELKEQTGDTKRKRWVNNEIQRLKEENQDAQQKLSELTA